MSEETIIGPQRCHQCGGEYGEHDSGCTESKEHKELTRLRAELATARSERDEWKRSAEGYNAEWLAARRELDEARRTVERLRAALERIVKADDEAIAELRAHGIVAADYDPVVAKCAREALAATPSAAPVVPPAMHASAPPEHKCSDCTIDQEPCPTCYEAWWKKKHPHYHLIESPVVPPPSTGTYPLFKHMADEHGLTLVESELLEIMDVVVLCGTVVPLAEAEMLAFVLELALKGSGYLGGTAAEVLAAYRAKHPPAEATARNP